MKKLLIVLCILLLITSCSPKISYTKEFPYLPSYKDMVTISDKENENQEQVSDSKKVTYSIKNGDLENILTEYETILHEDGWKTVIDGKPNMLQLEKDQHTALIVAYNKDNEIRLDITSK